MQLTKQVLTSSIDNFLIIYKQIYMIVSYIPKNTQHNVLYIKNFILMKGRDDYYWNALGIQ